MQRLGWLGISMLALWSVLLFGFRNGAGYLDLLLILGVSTLIWAVVNAPVGRRR